MYPNNYDETRGISKLFIKWQFWSLPPHNLKHASLRSRWQSRCNSNLSMQRLHLDEEIQLSDNFTPEQTRRVDRIAFIEVGPTVQLLFPWFLKN